MKRFIHIVLILLISAAAQSQMMVKGIVVDEYSGKGLKGAHIICEKGGGISKDSGSFEFLFQPFHGVVTLQISFLGYEDRRIPIEYVEGEKLLVIKLIKKSYQLQPHELVDHTLPEPVFHSRLHYVHDFELYDNQLVLITFNHSLRKDPSITLADVNQEIVYEQLLDDEPLGLYRDFIGRIYVEYERMVQYVHVYEDSLYLQEVSVKEYVGNVKPCKDSVGDIILFSDQAWYLPRFNYFAFDVQDSLVFLLKSVVHPEVNHMMRWQYYDMEIDDQRKARKIAAHFPELDEQEVAGLMTGFQHSFFYEEPYAPLFIRKDTILLFDHHSDFIYRFTADLETIDSIPIAYHKPKKRRSWKKKLHFDQEDQTVYGMYEINGYTYLKLVNSENGEVDQVNKLQNQFVEKVRVHDKYAYYLYKKPNSPTKPFIYRELLSDSSVD